jgi:DNA-binding NarL/FixJ family response regulator
MTTRIFIVEDHPAVRRGYGLLINHEPDLEVCGAAVSGEEALTLIPESQPDLVIMDLSRCGMAGTALINHLYSIQPLLPILIVSGYERAAYSNRNLYPLPPNLKDYLLKDEVPQRLGATIRQVLVL